MLKCTLITDDKIGNIHPATGLAEKLSEHISLTIHHLKVRKSLILYFFPLFILRLCPPLIPKLLGPISGPINEFSDIIIGNGSASVKYCAALRIFYRASHKKSFFIQLQNPSISSAYFDLVIPPMHDHVRGENIISTLGALTHINVEKIAAAKVPYQILELRPPIYAVFIGGRSKRHAFSPDDAEKLARDLKIFMVQNKCALAITTSRRTGAEQIKVLQKIIGTHNVYFWDGQTENPYFAMLKYCDKAIVTADSVNMISEIATAGLQMLLYPMRGRDGKFKYFYNMLKRRAYIQDFTHNPVFMRPPKRLDEIERILPDILQHLKEVL
ncbi:MAG: mitochondrial fission ELM1 family protein [Pseudomonadota bacterium]